MTRRDTESEEKTIEEILDIAETELDEAEKASQSIDSKAHCFTSIAASFLAMAKSLNKIVEAYLEKENNQ